ncbi:MAG: hypothetical protein ACRDN0_28845 [Trebonia sp.]
MPFFVALPLAPLPLAPLPLALLLVPLLLAATAWMDRLEPEPRGNLVAAFAWGAGVAALFALLASSFSACSGAAGPSSTARPTASCTPRWWASASQ